MGKPKVTAKRIMYIAAVQIVITTVGFIMYKRPYLWAWTALEYYKKITCGDNLDAVNAKYESYSIEVRSQVIDKVSKYNRQCTDEYLSSFTDLFNEVCLDTYKSAFVHIPLASCFLILGIVAVLHGKPFNKKTLKKPGFIIAFFFSLILVAINIGQIISIIVPVINPNASPDRGDLTGRRERCGYATELMSLTLIIASSVLSGCIAFYVIKLYVFRVKYQDHHIHDLEMTDDHSDEEEAYEKAMKKEQKQALKQQTQMKAPPLAGGQMKGQTKAQIAQMKAQMAQMSEHQYSRQQTGLYQ